MKVEYWKDKNGLVVEEFTDIQEDKSKGYSSIGFNTSRTFLRPARLSIVRDFFTYASRLQFEVH